MDFQTVYQYTKNLKVLYVEDDIDLLDETRDALEDFFLDVDTAMHGKEALDKFKLKIQNNSPLYDLIITDLNMPIMDGMALIKEVHAINKEQSIIVISAYNESSRLINLIQSGISNFIMKPIIPIQLMNMLLKTCKVIVETKELNRYRKKLEDSNENLTYIINQQADEIRYTQQISIETIANMVESYDDDTGTHVKRIQTYSSLLLDELSLVEDLDENFIATLPFAAVLHDIGKLMIPKDILIKPGKLTPDEFHLIKDHAKLGGEVLKKANLKFRDNFNKDSYLKIASDIAMHHHEKYNGEGYPDGLKEDDIPIAARIVSLADVYDALRSKRVYKEGFSHEESVRIIAKESGKSFDPQLVNIFIKINEEFKRVFHELS